MFRFLLAIQIAAMLFPVAYAQQDDPAWSSQELPIGGSKLKEDSLPGKPNTFGTFAGHIRSFSMATFNHRAYPDYFAQGMGAGLGYYSPIVKNFQVGMSGFLMYNLASSALDNQPPFNNRYEVGLFDVLDPDNRHNLGRVEDLYLRYIISKKSKSFVQIGKFGIKTPMMNPQDGRMLPNLQEGVWAEWKHWRKIKISGGWLWGTSPRSTVSWFNFGETIGIYPTGRAVNGAKANYVGKLQVPGVAIAGLSYLPFKPLRINLWSYSVPTLFSTSLLSTEWSKVLDASIWVLGVQYLNQQSLYKGSLPIEEQYIAHDERANAVGVKISRSDKLKKSEWSLNYTRIGDSGRFLFPREWGIEPFFTFMNRERMEGSGDVHAAVIKNMLFLDDEKRFSIQSMAGIFFMPALDDPQLNKYNMPSFYQFNLRSRYSFGGFLHGLKADLMYVYKGKLEKDLMETPANFHNKVDMHHLSFVFDYYF